MQTYARRNKVEPQGIIHLKYLSLRQLSSYFLTLQMFTDPFTFAFIVPGQVHIFQTQLLVSYTVEMISNRPMFFEFFSKLCQFVI
jgi:hypothetical protein